MHLTSVFIEIGKMLYAKNRMYGSVQERIYEVEKK